MNLDFDRLFPDATLKLILNWDKHYEKIFEAQKHSCRDIYARQLMTILEDTDLTNGK